MDYLIAVLSTNVAAAAVGLAARELEDGAAPESSMVQEGEVGGAGGLIAPRRIPNPCLQSPQRMDLHRELLFNQRIGSEYKQHNSATRRSRLERLYIRDEPQRKPGLLEVALGVNFQGNAFVVGNLSERARCASAISASPGRRRRRCSPRKEVIPTAVGSLD
ncbi:hypothetical protein EVAR_94799_1 [Eumeta japonica]|uniref:Uncharacterized protein n=1 Tax=Eumeta variegata TaxID=151549 RepID=A0A4C1UH61_EUMVA|nr:hypothetical protein EVAR_94799_1 [Eumeta japonica]